MESEPSLEDWFKSIEYQPEIEKPFIEEELNIKRHGREVAYHESGHFLIDCLIEKEKLGFTKILEAQIYVDKDAIKGNVKKKEDPNRKTETQREFFYLENINRIAYRILTLSAGYATYLKFFKKEEYYIGIFQDKILKRYKLKFFPTYNANFDYIKIKKLLTYHGITKREFTLSIIEFTSNELIKFMACSPNKCAIGFVKNTFLKNNKVLLKGSKIKGMKKRVNIHTKNIYLTSLLNKIGNEIIRIKEKQKPSC